MSCHNDEHLPICICFVDSECNIREEFIAFIKLGRVRAVDISDAIIKSLENIGLSLSNLRGQGYDGASTMSGARVGVQARICEKQPKAIYTHCAGHSLNLAIGNSCLVPAIRNCIDRVKGVTLWVKKSAKRERLFKAIVTKGIRSHPSSRRPLFNVCITRWVENKDGWERFSLAHPFMIKMFEAIQFGNSEYPQYNDGWLPEDKQNALAFMNALESFEFIYCLITLYRSMSYLKEAVVKLQGKNRDIVSGVSIVMQCCGELKKLRENVDNYSHLIFQHGMRNADQSGISVSMPRVAQCQQHHANPVEDFFKKTVAIPFLDHMISDVSSRFTAHSKMAASLQALLPVNITPATSCGNMQEVIDLYSDDLPNPNILDEEISRWKPKWLPIPQQDHPETFE